MFGISIAVLTRLLNVLWTSCELAERPGAPLSTGCKTSAVNSAYFEGVDPNRALYQMPMNVFYTRFLSRLRHCANHSF